MVAPAGDGSATYTVPAGTGAVHAARVDSTPPTHNTMSASASPGSAATAPASAACAAAHPPEPGSGHRNATRNAFPAVRLGHISGTGNGGTDPASAL